MYFYSLKKKNPVLLWLGKIGSPYQESYWMKVSESKMTSIDPAEFNKMTFSRSALGMSSCFYT